jgi:hypothetical protein
MITPEEAMKIPALPGAFVRLRNINKPLRRNVLLKFPGCTIKRKFSFGVNSTIFFSKIIEKNHLFEITLCSCIAEQLHYS